MDLYYSKTFSDEDGVADKAKSVMMFSNKEELLKMCDFFSKVKQHILEHDNCHMHLCDYFEKWNKKEHFDIEVNIYEEN